MECPYCSEIFKTKYNLEKHVKTSKRCIQKREIKTKTESNYVCFTCKHDFSDKFSLERHTKICTNKNQYILAELSDTKDSLKKTIEKYKENECNIIELNNYRVGLDNANKIISSKDDIIGQLIIQLEQKDKTIQKLTRKQSRPQIKDQNVIYILTTPSLKQKNNYIIGKAINLTTRLSTYNKSDEHEVVYYRQCKDEHLLVTTETIILDKLKEYKEFGNRDRITIPDDKNIKCIIDIIDECITFMNK